MPRRRRIWHPEVFNHVVMRGNNRQPIFKNERDFFEFYRILHNTYEKYPFTLSAYCIMTNHYHLLIQSPEVPLSKIMRIINWRYSDYFKKRYSYSGHLYENRYFSDLVSTPFSMLKVSRYIHRNPINTKTPMVSNMELYPYSSYNLYKFGQTPIYPFIDTEPLLNCLLYPTLQSKHDYIQFCETPEDALPYALTKEDE
ncbi:transposase [Lysinibacillus sp. SGAir0095]|uniref:transposase n=1 Tax=Lysinibacillus sp. SGAir0095 TaxID=2070463 RepID=UPI0010CD30E7|nr:transposase [Lysinibacillus sp. SGAir0095]QCR31457.1 transposase [Lysinibacillus sp. SGAir0095]